MVMCGMGKEMGKIKEIIKDIERFFEHTCFVTEWAETVYDAVLLFRKDDVILPGSKVEVMDSENVMLFSSVGEMVPYQTHNEIALKREDVI